MIKLPHNQLSPAQIQARLAAETEPRTPLSCYRYFPVADPKAFRDQVYLALDPLAVFGRIYVAHEGINAQFSAPASRVAEVSACLRSLPGLEGIDVKPGIAPGRDEAFIKLVVKVKKSLVADGLREGEGDPLLAAPHLSAAEFNAALDLPDATVVDMRNGYESEVGHFDRAWCPEVETFREQLPLVVERLKDKKHAPVLMYCTGGIRCEKASAYLRQHGFSDVRQLDGGILGYVRGIRENGLPSRFHGRNFVFDGRLGEKVTDEILARCFICGAPADEHQNCADTACHRLHIRCPDCAHRLKDCCSEDCLASLDLPEAQHLERRRRLAAEREAFYQSRHHQGSARPG
ncbi:MAG: hypothetical protein RL095_4144 [Verrucomicrobiota bacterium]|jgi:UPF0176 protein